MGKTAIVVSIFLGMGGAASYGMTDEHFLQPRNEFTPEVAEQPERLRFTPVEARRPMRRHPNKFTPKEDERLAILVGRFGADKWGLISAGMLGRNPRQCRERWSNYLAPDTNRNPFTEEEKKLLLEKYNELGPQWRFIKRFFLRRTTNQLKNCYQQLKQKIETTEGQFRASLPPPFPGDRSTTRPSFPFDQPSTIHSREDGWAPKEGSERTPQFPSEEAFRFPLEEAFQSPLFEGPSQSSSDNDPYGGGDFDP